jgi:putative spermidine/putrescine transport system substrate-binding protein
MITKIFKTLVLGALLLINTGVSSAKAADAICYNCPPQWADWASQLKSIKKALGLRYSS